MASSCDEFYLFNAAISHDAVKLFSTVKVTLNYP